MDLFIEWSQFLDHSIYLFLERFILVRAQPRISTGIIIVQFGSFSIKINVFLEIFPGRGSSCIIPLLPVVFQLFSVSAAGHDLRQFRFQCQITLAAIMIITHLDFSVVFLHIVNGIQHLGKLFLRQCRVTQPDQFLHPTLQLLILKAFVVKLSEILRNVLKVCCIFGSDFILHIQIIVRYVRIVSPVRFTSRITTSQDFLLNVLQVLQHFLLLGQQNTARDSNRTHVTHQPNG
uniref:Uncharacterized protein n=1 Tax=Anopheles christyi TaxID=43041 RepID=A0A182KJ63_9DIPT